MNELKKINAAIAKKQILRIVGSVLGMGLGLVCFGQFIHHQGVRDCQKALQSEFPEEYAAMTAKIVGLFEKG